MAASSVGTASLNLTLDTSEFSVAIDRAKQQQAGLGQAAQQEAARMTQAQRRVINGLDRQTATAGLTRKEMTAFNIITRTTGETQAALLAKLQANTREITNQGKALNAYGVSAAQQAAALRGVPAQMTDIFVSLQGGQNPLTVLFQQGGQLKDMFGGVVPAAKALGGAVMGLIGPTTILAAGTVALGVAWYQGEKESRNFERALISTGQNSDGLTQKMIDLSASLDGLKGVTQSGAADALTQVAATGTIAAENLELVTRAALAMKSSTGKAVSDTVAEFAALAKDPVDAILELNRSQNFLTEETLNAVRAAQEQGRAQDAAAIATKAYAEVLISRSADMSQNLGLLEKAWKGVKGSALEAWDAMFDIGRANTTSQSMAQIQGMIDSMERTGGLMYANPAAKASRDQTLANLRKQLADLQSTAAKGNTPAARTTVNTEAYKQLQAINESNKSKEERQKLEETQIVNLYKQLGISKEDKRVQDALAASAARYKESGPKSKSGASEARSLANANASAELQAIKNGETEQRAEISNTTKVLQAQYAARLVDTNAYYAKSRELVRSDFAAQEDSLTKQIAFLKSRDLTGKDSVNTTKEISELEAKLAKVRADGATQLAILGIQEDSVAEKRKSSVKAYKDALDTSLEASKQSADAQLARIILGQREFEQQEKLAAVTAKAAAEQKKLAREYADNGDLASYEEKLAVLQKYTDLEVQVVQQGYDRMSEAQADWMNGLKGGLAQWMENASNVAEQTAAITQDGLDAVAQGFTNLATTGKSQWKSLLADIGEEITKFMMKQAVMQFIKMFTSAYMGSGSDAGGFADLFGGDSFSYFAKGGVPDSGSNISAYSGTVVSKPTYFANGGNVMGEAGHEGIFPLARGTDGKLGVKAMGGGGSGGSQITIETNVYVTEGGTTSTTQTAGAQAAMYRDFAEMVSAGAQREITKARMPGGQLWKVGVG